MCKEKIIITLEEANIKVNYYLLVLHTGGWINNEMNIYLNQALSAKINHINAD